jgi:hypothetical protein
LWRVCGSNARELGALAEDDIQVAVGPVVIPESDIRTYGLIIRGIQLNHAGNRQKTL